MPDNHIANLTDAKIHPIMAAAPTNSVIKPPFPENGTTDEKCRWRYTHGEKVSRNFANIPAPKQDSCGNIIATVNGLSLTIDEHYQMAIIPQALRDIAANLAIQDNRCTSDPQFLVQKKVRQTGQDLDYCDDYIWLDCYNDYKEVTDFERIKRLEELEGKYPLTKDEEGELNDYLKTGYVDRWETVQTFFTEVEADRYIAANSHRREEKLRTYVEWGGRNPEGIAIRNFLLSLNPPKQSTTT